MPFPVTDPKFGKRYLQVELNPDDEMLKQVAEATGGKYYRAENVAQLKSALQDISSNLNKE